MSGKPKILIVAGEVSGDHHAADLVAAIQARSGNRYQFLGIGGDTMRGHGVELLYHISDMAFLGIAEIIRHLPFIKQVKRDLQTEMKKGVEAVILVDYPGFNLRVARDAAELGVPVIYYISPQLWAWGQKRVEKVRRYVDLMLVLFRFEKDFYAGHGIEAAFVGHPLVDQIRPEENDRAFREEHGIPEGRRILALLPGSRKMEVAKLLPIMAESARQLCEEYDVLPIIGKSSQLPQALYDEVLPKDREWQTVTGQTHRLMQHAYLAMVASGTATLETGFLQTPMMVCYAVAPLTYYFGRMVIKIPNIALANIVLGKAAVPEFIQKDLNVPNLVRGAGRFLRDEGYYRSVREDLKGIREALGEPGASQRAAAEIVEFLDIIPRT
ncbi:MAG TPA: lipid-A-disaccharide synthase [Calditrichia bacterium]|nr:lipid-A-disaccharide synthase [Calditrichota bacterium]HQV30925.1 lipid-A-disaccharide synthase [Calditrichia bacterium]